MNVIIYTIQFKRKCESLNRNEEFRIKNKYLKYITQKNELENVKIRRLCRSCSSFMCIIIWYKNKIHFSFTFEWNLWLCKSQGKLGQGQNKKYISKYIVQYNTFSKNHDVQIPWKKCEKRFTLHLGPWFNGSSFTVWLYSFSRRWTVLSGCGS